MSVYWRLDAYYSCYYNIFLRQAYTNNLKYFWTVRTVQKGKAPVHIPFKMFSSLLSRRTGIMIINFKRSLFLWEILSASTEDGGEAEDVARRGVAPAMADNSRHKSAACANNDKSRLDHRTPSALTHSGRIYTHQIQRTNDASYAMWTFDCIIGQTQFGHYARFFPTDLLIFGSYY